MLRTTSHGNFIFDNNKTPVTGNEHSWLIRETATEGVLEVVRFNSDSSADKPVEFVLTENGWKMNALSALMTSQKIAARAKFFARNLIESIKQQLPMLYIEQLICPDQACRANQLYYRSYTLTNITDCIVPVTDPRCSSDVAVRAVDTIKSLNLSRPKTLLFSDVPGKLPEEVPTEQVEAKLGICWTDTNVMQLYNKDELRCTLGPITPTPYSIIEDAFRQIETNRSMLGICFINDTIGFGVRAMNDIPRQTILTTYAGQLLPLSEQATFNFRDSGYSIASTTGQHSTTCVIESKKYRNMGGMFTHLPALATRDKYMFLPGVQENVAIQNLGLRHGFYRDQPLMLLFSFDPIKKGHLAGFDYGEKYWTQLGTKPSLLLKDGQIVPPETYVADLIHIKVVSEKKGIFISLDINYAELMRAFLTNNGVFFGSAGKTDDILAFTREDFLTKYNADPHQLHFTFQDVYDSLVFQSANVKSF